MTLDELELLSIALIDIRASLEAQRRLINATEVCVEVYRSQQERSTLTEIGEHLQRMLDKRADVEDGVREAIAALQALMTKAPAFPPSGEA